MQTILLYRNWRQRFIKSFHEQNSVLKYFFTHWGGWNKKNWHPTWVGGAFYYSEDNTGIKAFVIRGGTAEYRPFGGGGYRISSSCHYWMPMTPQATLLPADPVCLLSSVPPFPRSSVPLCTTTVRPMMLWAPCSEMTGSVMLTTATPCSLATMLPRSPTWRSVSLGAPCFFCEKQAFTDFTAHPLSTVRYKSWQLTQSLNPVTSMTHDYKSEIGQPRTDSCPVAVSL